MSSIQRKVVRSPALKKCRRRLITAAVVRGLIETIFGASVFPCLYYSLYYTWKGVSYPMSRELLTYQQILSPFVLTIFVSGLLSFIKPMKFNLLNRIVSIIFILIGLSEMVRASYAGFFRISDPVSFIMGVGQFVYIAFFGAVIFLLTSRIKKLREAIEKINPDLDVTLDSCSETIEIFPQE